MKSLGKTLIALVSLLGAFYLSISYRYGDPGWRLEFEPASTASAESGVIDGGRPLVGGATPPDERRRGRPRG